MHYNTRLLPLVLMSAVLSSPLACAEPDAREIQQTRAAWEEADQKLRDKWQSYRSRERDTLRLEEEWLKSLTDLQNSHMRVCRARQALSSPRRDWDYAQRKDTYGAPRSDWEAADKALKKWVDYDKRVQQEHDNFCRLQEVALRKQQAWQESVKRLRSSLAELRREQEEVDKKRAAWQAAEKR